MAKKQQGPPPGYRGRPKAQIVVRGKDDLLAKITPQNKPALHAMHSLARSILHALNKRPAGDAAGQKENYDVL